MEFPHVLDAGAAVMLSRFGLLPLVLFVASGAIRAHELGAVQIRARFEQTSRFELRVEVNPSHLPPELRSLALASPDDRQRLVDTLARGLSPRFDGVATKAGLRWNASDSQDPSGGIVLAASGSAPFGARGFDIGVDLPTGASYLLCVSPDGTEEAQWIAPGSRSQPCAPAAASIPAPRREAHQVAMQYVGLGFTHIVPWGADHILFVLGLFLFSRGLRPMLTQVTAFTLAHSVSLGLAASGLVSSPPRVVEPLIAISIVVVAFENVFARSVSTRRTLLVFAFGLVHGLGFAGVLRELGLPQGRFFVALVSFNVGVEAGQIFVIASAFALVGWWAKRRSWYRRWVVVPASLAIGTVGLLWAIERLIA